VTRAAPPAVTVGLFFVGTLLCVPHFYVPLGPAVLVAVAVTWNAAYILSWRAASPLVRGLAGAVSLGWYALSIYTAVLFTTVLGWSLPLWEIVLIVVAFLAALVTRAGVWRAVAVPAVLPLGLLITL
jgi:hypothetical protein